MDVIISTQEDGIVINCIQGKLNIDELIYFIKNNICSWVGKHVIWDLNLTDLSSIKTEDWKTIIDKCYKLAEERHGEKTALISSSDFSFGMIRMLEVIAEMTEFPIHMQSFRTIENAKGWFYEP